MRKIKKDSAEQQMYQSVLEGYRDSGIGEARRLYKDWKACTSKRAQDEVADLCNFLNALDIWTAKGNLNVDAAMEAITLTDEEVAQEEREAAEWQIKYLYQQLPRDIKECKEEALRTIKRIREEIGRMEERLTIFLDEPRAAFYDVHMVSRALDLDRTINKLQQKVDAFDDMKWMFTKGLQKLTGIDIIGEEDGE